MENLFGEYRIEVTRHPWSCTIKVLQHCDSIHLEDLVFGIDIYFKTMKFFYDLRLIARTYQNRFVTQYLFQKSSENKYNDCIASIHTRGGAIV